MVKLIVFEIGEGNFEQGFPVIVRIGEDGQRHSAEITSEQFPTFPPAPDIPERYQNWRSTYCKLGHVQRIILPPSQITNVSSREECDNAASALVSSLNNWLNQPSVLQLERLLLHKVNESEKVRFIIKTQNPWLRRLPWHLWDFFQTCFPQSEIALSTDYQPSAQNLKSPVKILALFGHSEGINTKKDLDTLTKLQGAKIEILQEPSKKELINKLRSQPWDILFFAGHSSSENGDHSGEIQINQQETLSLQSLRNSLRYAVQKGLKLAFFNSCDGLGLANSLADLKIPYIVVMREPVS
jgi:branched-chain amino acid transport system substrate-binding protein